MTTPTNSSVTIPRWLLLVIAGGAAAAMIVAVIVVVVSGDEGDTRAASQETTTQVESIDYDEVELPSLPYTEVVAWSSERVDMEGGDLPEGTIFRNPDSNPSWVKVNRFTGEVHYAPQAKGIQYRPYDIVVRVEFPDGETAEITSTVEVVRYDDGKDDEADEDIPVLPRTEVRAGDVVTVSLENNDLPAGTRYTKSSGPPWMRVDRDTGDVTYTLDETVVGYAQETRRVRVVASLPHEGDNIYIGEDILIFSEVEVVE